MLLGVVRRFMGLSTDTKPTSVPFGSEFFEEDTGVTYVYSSAGWVLRYGKSVLTPEGGVAILLKNSTGAATVKGSVVHSGSGNAEVILITDSIPDAIGVFYDSGVADGQLALVVVCGVADVGIITGPFRGSLGPVIICLVYRLLPAVLVLRSRRPLRPMPAKIRVTLRSRLLIPGMLIPWLFRPR